MPAKCETLNHKFDTNTSIYLGQLIREEVNFVDGDVNVIDYVSEILSATPSDLCTCKHAYICILTVGGLAY